MTPVSAYNPNRQTPPASHQRLLRPPKSSALGEASANTAAGRSTTYCPRSQTHKSRPLLSARYLHSPSRPSLNCVHASAAPRPISLVSKRLWIVQYQGIVKKRKRY